MTKFLRKGEFLIIGIQNETTIEELFRKLLLNNVNYKVLRKNKEVDDTNLVKGDNVWIKAFLNEEVNFEPIDRELEVVYEDDLLLIVNKEPGIIVHLDGNLETETLCNIVANYYLQTNQHLKVSPIHRLDRETTGLVIFSKCKALQPHFDNLLKEKKINREYYALVDGYYRPGFKFKVEQPIGKDRHERNKRRISKTGQYALSLFECVDANKENNCALVKCNLKTGRTHQIRVHLSSNNHPIKNDRLYNTRYDGGKMMLEAYKITIDDFLYDNLVVEIEEMKEFSFYM